MLRLERNIHYVHAALILLAVYWIALFIGTHTPLIIPQLVPTDGDKWLHWAAYLGLTLLACGAIITFTHLRWYMVLGVGVGLALYGALDEWLQSFVGRSCDLGDWKADVKGILVGMVISYVGYLCLHFWKKYRLAKRVDEAERVSDEPDREPETGTEEAPSIEDTSRDPVESA